MTILLERDELSGYHAVVIDAADQVIWITDSYPNASEAEREACEWCEKNARPVAQAS